MADLPEGGAADEVLTAEVDGHTVHATRGEPALLDNRADDAYAELEALRLRAARVGVDYQGMPLRDLRAAVEQAEREQRDD